MKSHVKAVPHAASIWCWSLFTINLHVADDSESNLMIQSFVLCTERVYLIGYGVPVNFGASGYARQQMQPGHICKDRQVILGSRHQMCATSATCRIVSHVTSSI